MDWRGFELNPETPRGGVLLERLFPGRAQAMIAHVKRFAQGFGLPDMRVPERLSNTRRAIAVAEWARTQGRLEAFWQAVMEARWLREEDLEDAEVLARAAEQAGLSAEGARAAMDAPEYQARVDALRAEGNEAGVSGIPTFFIGDIRVVGCQPYEVLAEAAQRAGARRRA